MRRIPILIASLLLVPPVGAERARIDPHHRLDRSKRVRTGTASFYGRRHAGRTMASGKPFSPDRLTAASRTLPLGTKARVVNTENGRSTQVTITDRGPYAKDRIIDVTTRAAERLGMKEDGTAAVAVKPVTIPDPDGNAPAISPRTAKPAPRSAGAPPG